MVEKIKSILNRDIKYRHGTCFKLFYGRIYCIQKENWIGNFTNIFETTDKITYENKIKEMVNNGISFQ